MICYQIKLEEDDLTFFIDNYKTASAICGANLRLSMRDGWKVFVYAFKVLFFQYEKL